MGQPLPSQDFCGTAALPRWSQPVNATLYLEGEMECALTGDRFHRGFTAAEKTELWDRWKRGESLKAIGRAFGKSSRYASGGEPLPRSREGLANLLGACADRASIGMESAEAEARNHLPHPTSVISATNGRKSLSCTS